MACKGASLDKHDEITLHLPWPANAQGIRDNEGLMELANSPRHLRLANVKPAYNFGVWDVSEVGCNNV
jgi:hypothetical protein